jgi:hypothetical protein
MPAEENTEMPLINLIVPLLFMQAASSERQLWLSPVTVGDCVAPRIIAKRTTFVDELEKKYCSEGNPDAAKARQCIKNSRMEKEFAFFTDRCSEDEYFIGINGKEVRLRRIAKQSGRPAYFLGSFAGEGVSVQISHPRLIKKTYLPGEPRNEENVLDAEYKVLIAVKKGALKKTYNGVFWYGR